MKSVKHIVNVYEQPTVQFTRQQVQKECKRINAGGKVNPAKMVKMLHQMQYVMAEYESLRFCVHSAGERLTRTANSHWIITQKFRA